MKKFEQVSSDGHQMSLTGGKGSHVQGVPVVRSHVWKGAGSGGGLYSENPCEQKDTTENITFPQLRCQGVIMLTYPFVCVALIQVPAKILLNHTLFCKDLLLTLLVQHLLYLKQRSLDYCSLPSVWFALSSMCVCLLHVRNWIIFISVAYLKLQK